MRSSRVPIWQLKAQTLPMRRSSLIAGAGVLRAQRFNVTLNSGPLIVCSFYRLILRLIKFPEVIRLMLSVVEVVPAGSVMEQFLTDGSRYLPTHALLLDRVWMLHPQWMQLTPRSGEKCYYTTSCHTSSKLRCAKKGN